MSEVTGAKDTMRPQALEARVGPVDPSVIGDVARLACATASDRESSGKCIKRQGGNLCKVQWWVHNDEGEVTSSGICVAYRDENKDVKDCIFD